jgi:3-dehydroquinate dehydratase-2
MPKPKRAADAASRRPKNLLVLHGPNLNLLSTREPEIYGAETLKTVNARLIRIGRERGARVDCFQSNHEGALIERIHSANIQRTSWIIVNPAGFTHTSVALRDAFAAVKIPFIEVHI